MASRPTDHVAVFLAGIASLCVVACEQGDLEMPPVKTPVRLRLACQPPQISPFTGHLAPPIGSSCGLPDLRCDERRPLVVAIDEHGNATAAYIPGMSSPELDACILKEVRDTGWEFEPARECSGDPMAGEYVTEEGIVCGQLARGATSGRTRS